MNTAFIKRNENDNQFVLELFCSHKIKELKGENWPESLKKQICLMQFSAFEKNIIKNGFRIKDLIIISKNKPIGRLILDELDDKILIAYIGVINSFQNMGYGKTVINKLIEKAKNKSKRLSLSVSKDNSAYFLYLKQGFVVTQEDDLSFVMTYTPYL